MASTFSNSFSYLASHMKANPKFFFMGALTLSLFTAAFFPALRLLFNIWMESEEYSHAVLTIPIIIYMVWSKRDELASRPDKYALPALLLSVTSTLFYLFVMLTQVQTFIFVSMYLTIIGSLVYLAGVGSVKTLAAPLILFLMLIPIPEQLYPQLTFPLQLKVSQVSETLVRIFGIPLLREGNVMHIPGKSFEVVEACSGLRSAITLLTLSIIMGYFFVVSIPSKIILFIFSIPIAIFVNIIRLVSMILLFYYFNLDLTTGPLHTTSGVFVFLIALLIFFLLQRILVRWEIK